MQVGHGRNRVLKLLIARREGLIRSRGYRRIVDVGRHDRGIDGEHVIALEIVDVVNEDALITLHLEGRSGCREYRLDICRLAGPGDVYLTAVSVDLRRWESRRQDLLLNCIFRDLIEGKVSASRPFEFRPDRKEDRRLGQLIYGLWNGGRIQRELAGVAGWMRHPVVHWHVRPVLVFLVR